MKLGTITKNMRQRSLEEIVSITSKIGYQAIEISARPNERHVLVDQIIQDEGRNVLEIVNGGGLMISALSCHLNLLDPEKGPEFRTHFDKVIRAASVLGVPVVTGLPGLAQTEKAEDAFNLLVEAWTPRLELAETLGIKVALEAFPPHIVYNMPTMTKLFELLDNPGFGLNFDPSHGAWQGIDNHLIVRAFGRRIFHAHAKDAEILQDRLKEVGTMGTGWWRFRIPGFGMVDWKRLISDLKEAGYDYALSFEHEDKTFGDLEGTEKAYEFLRELI